MNKIFLVGKLGKEPEVKKTSNDKEIARFSIATSEPPYKQGGDWITTWHEIRVFGKSVEIVKAMHKGDEVFIEGSIAEDRWKDRDGNEKKFRYVKSFFVRITNPKVKDETNTPHDDSGSW